MRVLGVAPDVWISSAALIEDGQVVAAAPEERFNRQKMSRAFPAGAIDYCLAQAGRSLEDIDRIAVPWNPGVHLSSASSRFTSALRWRGEYMASVPSALLNHFGSPKVGGVEEVLRLLDGTVNIEFVNHHMAHAANAFLLSPFESAAILTVDGRGEEETSTLNVGRDGQIEKLQAVRMPHSLGLIYGVFTEYLGFKPHSDEWKVMALASYGCDESAYYSRVRGLVNLLDEGGFEADLSYFTYYLFDRQPAMFTSKLEQLLGPRRAAGDPIEERHHDIAAALQRVFEESTTHMLRHLHRVTGESNLVLSGGSAMNSVFNGKVLDITPYDELFVSSCPDDSGVSVGAALYVCNNSRKGNSRYPQRHNYWGPGYSREEISETLSKYMIPAERHEDIARVAARLTSQGKIVGWFQGRMEFGQRALGNRSILADPRDLKTKGRVNAAVKYRESFRPFAPSVIEERASDWFLLPEGTTVPFMEKVCSVRPDKRELVPAVVHVDGSCRIQTVSKAINPRFHEYIRAFEELTGVPVVLNTSFNLNGEPIVCTPTDAIRTFFSCGLEYLVLGDFLIAKDGRSAELG